MTEVPPLEPPEPAGADPLALIPRISGRQARLERALRGGPWKRDLALAHEWLTGPLGESLEIGEVGYLETLSGLRRPGAIAQVRCPALQVTLGLHLETTLAHALVDRMLGFERADGAQRLQVTPVEWGILTYALARSFSELATAPGAPEAAELIVERVGPEPFRPEPTVSYLTLFWPVRVGNLRAEARAWVPDSYLLELTKYREYEAPGAGVFQRFGSLGTLWIAEAGRATIPRGLSRLRVGAVVPIDGFPLSGTAASPSGPVSVVLRGLTGRHVIPARPAPHSGGGRLVVDGTSVWEPHPREPLSVSATSDPKARIQPGAPAADLPVTLIVELGRVNIPLTRLADLKPGDLLELGRHSREPVELTSNGRLVARGELVQIDTELGVRITNLLL